MKTEFTTTGWDSMYFHLMNISSTEELYRDNTEEIEEILNALSTCDPKEQRTKQLIEKLLTYNDGLGHLSAKHATTIIQNLVKVGTKHRHNVLTSYADNFDLLNKKYEKIFWKFKMFFLNFSYYYYFQSSFQRCPSCSLDTCQ